MIPIYIGMSKRFECIKGMTARSIMANTKADIRIKHIYPEVEAGCTGFTNVRYQIDFGIYLDPDMIVLGDIAELWRYRRSRRFVCMRDGSTEVAVIDCQHLCRNKFEEHLLPKENIIPDEWNVEDHKYFPDNALPENIKNFHFTSLSTQPWFFEHPNSEAKMIYENWK